MSYNSWFCQFCLLWHHLLYTLLLSSLYLHLLFFLLLLLFLLFLFFLVFFPFPLKFLLSFLISLRFFFFLHLQPPCNFNNPLLLGFISLPFLFFLSFRLGFKGSSKLYSILNLNLGLQSSNSKFSKFFNLLIFLGYCSIFSFKSLLSLDDTIQHLFLFVYLFHQIGQGSNIIEVLIQRFHLEDRRVRRAS